MGQRELWRSLTSFNTSFIATPQECDKNSIPQVGGKAASLGELWKAEAPIPPFFTITSTAYREFIKHNNLTPLITKLNNISSGNLLKTATELRNAILGGAFPQKLEEELKKAYKELASKWNSLAVRSSATMEDAPKASFAGQYESYLGIRGEREFLEAIKKCYASLYTDRAVTYRQKIDISHDGIYMAVITQSLVNAKSAGVMFTVNPLNGDPSSIVIESSWGLGEAVVKGEVIPDKYTINKVTKEVLELRRSRNKSIKYVMLDDGSVVKKDCTDEAAELSLSQEEAVKLAEIGVKLEKYFGTPQDIEWVADNRLKTPNNIFIVQSRPVTTVTTVDKPSKQTSLNTMDRIINTLLTGSKT